MCSKLRKFRRAWRSYIAQSFLAALTIFLVLLFLSLEHAIVIAAIGATAFIVFAMPENVCARPRGIIGGHSIGFAVGCLCALLPQPSLCWSIMAYSLAVGLSILLMVVDMEHPPAASTALGLALRGFSVNAAIAVLTSILLLALAHRVLRPYLRDLV
ncbi:MAG: HPP family protein [Chloroflexota bacterium]